ncbi:MAG: OmpA family protein [Nitrospiraceae bacterium]|nr:OmpA family protein [Nitrospiraceae bacterium]
MNDGKIIIRKKVKRRHAEGHGGAWKVAYADFVTAMMAFFLLMWLITMVSPEKRARVAEYFKQFNIFTKTGQSFMDKSSSVFDESGSNASKLDLELQKKFQGQQGGMDSPQEIMKGLKVAIQKQLGSANDQIKVDIYEGGVRIQIMDSRGRPMFDSGSSNPTPYAKKVLHVIGEYIKSMPNRVAIEGHTDAMPYVKGDQTNWDLSTERALSTRRILQDCGLDPSRVSRVAGYADTVPLVKDDPLDPRNRRISIILLFGGTYHRPG